MPNFHTHWLVALQTIDQLPAGYDFLRSGRNSYVVASLRLRDEVRKLAGGILSRLDLDGAAALQGTIGKMVTGWEDSLRGDRDAICFSAYMLGACGPDFWMLPCDTAAGVKPDFAAIHFDLGHYNRSHLQFEVSLQHVAGLDVPDARVEKSYFLGMATHLGADLVLHQLVNVYAGAYDLLKGEVKRVAGQELPNGTWSNEQGCEYLSPLAAPEEGTANQRRGHYAGELFAKTLGDAVPIWTTHNKVEHYWDTWVRYRWLGDFGQVWADDVDSGLPLLRLPLCDTLRRDLLGRTGDVSGMGNSIGHKATDVYRGLGRLLPGDDTKNKRATVIDRLDHALGSVETRWLLEKPLAFPWLFCDAVLAGKHRPFIYDRVVKKEGGAYPRALLFDKADGEAGHPQMSEPSAQEATPADQKDSAAAGGGPSEKRKLMFFSTPRNHAIPPASWNYLNYLTCPNLPRLQRFGKDVFYERRAFAPFVRRGADLAAAFARELGVAYGTPGTRIPKLARFWNLDTGLGLRVQTVQPAHRDRHEVVTRIDWVHALGPAGTAGEIEYVCAPSPGYAQPMKTEGKEPYPLRAWKDADRAFHTHHPAPFENLGAVVEDDAFIDQRRYLTELRLKHPLAAVEKGEIFDRIKDRDPPLTDDEFEAALFQDDCAAPTGERVDCRTGTKLKAKSFKVDHRLDLVVRASIARLGAGAGDVAMYLLGDAAGAVQDPASEDAEQDGAAPVWLRRRSRILDRVLEADRDRAAAAAGLATFSARILVNLSDEDGKARARVVSPAGKWNNVVPHGTHQGHYGRNFAVATARKNVLQGSSHSKSYDFDATTDFTYLPDLALTEHCFFTIYPLVKLAGGWVDAFTGTPVARGDFAKMKKLEAINFVKIVLLYVVDRGAVQLRWSYLDGVRTPVERVPE